MIDHINQINEKILDYYNYIKLFGKNKENYKEFIKGIEKNFEYISKEVENKDNDIDKLSQTSKSDLINRLEENIKDIEFGLKEIQYNFKNRKEIFLDFDFFTESKGLTITLNDFNKYGRYLGGYCILGLKSLLVLWKNEINLLDESMSFHHREKSKLDIKKVQQILKEEVEKEKNLEEGKKILKEILGYSEFLCFKFGISPKIEFIINYEENYKEFIEFINFINEIEKSKENKEYRNIENINENEVKNELNLFKYFLYLKDYKYKKEPEKSYKKLKHVLKNHNFKKHINIIFFINNLISLLNKIAEKGNKKLKYSEEIEFINDFIEEKDLKETYFTKYKFAQLYKNLGKLNNNLINFETAEYNINESIKKFEKQNGAYYPFIATSDIFYEKNEKIFSFSTFIKSQKTDYYLRIKQEQIKILEEKSELKLSLKIDEVNEKIKGNEQILDDKLYENNVKTIEILAIFSAIVMFVSSSIQVYQYLSDTKSTIIFMMSFALSLIGFIGLIIFLVSKKVEIWKYFIFIITFIIGFIFIYLQNINNTPILNKEYKDKIKEEIINDLEKTKNLLKI